MPADAAVGFTATLTIGADKFDVLSFGTSFSRDYDQKGRPSSAVRAGDLALTIEITQNEKLIDAMINSQNKAVDGKIEFWQSGKDGIFRSVVFTNGYITSYKEGFQPAGSSNFSADISISAEKVDIGLAKYDAGWPLNS
ncbi:type VI secretion system tube protein TssD [Spirosoma flavum]|uniref:Type VI secretion system tube protein TssD n=1 Tax=Spirosoma flavum TaxID=2048557 RepID=A0ABW6AHL9_9BACT